VRSKFRPTKLITFLSIFVIFAFVFVSFAGAITSRQPTVLPADKKATPSAKPKGRDKMKDRLTEVKLKVCEKKEATIQRRSTRLVGKVEKILSNFDRIVQKVDDFYVDKVVPKVGEMENYEQLLNKNGAKRQEVYVALGAATETANNFTCEGVDPKDQIKQFRVEMKSVTQALKEYKHTIIDYLVAVKTKAKNIRERTATKSAEPATSSAEED
jgi:hypothetical protein